ncbi:energy transducer TonB [Aquabacterium sp.]|uniref:energy transducer TonB n=1 Tax=Aquabacterium sp. TaxID=1872578 RepID=UPI002E35B090|nr:energy transducer TonB [Aquabacterium sp.]HEX5312087.1 energy transducer TonB [Aquabacterium sp.]
MLQKLRTTFSKLTLLHKTLAISVGIHAALLGFRFVDPEGFNRTFKDTPLEVILVNSGGDQAPEKPQALAQQNLAGGGESDKKNERATSPFKPSDETEVGDALEQTARMIEEMQQEQQQMLAQLKKELSALPPPDPRQKAETQQAQAEEERRRQLTKLIGEIDKRINDQNSRPKKRYLSPATLKSVDALYYNQFRTVVERAGTTHFPTDNRGQKLYGELVMEVWINQMGQILDAIVTVPSRNPTLDKRAQAIVKNSGPFPPVPTDVMAGKDVLLISSRFKFTREAGVSASTEATAPSTQP